MSWFINGIKEWSTDFTTTFNTSQSTTTTFSTSQSTTTTFSTSRSTTTTFSTSKSTTTTFSTSKTTSTTTTATTYGPVNNAANSGSSRWIVYQSYNVAHMNYIQGHWWNDANNQQNFVSNNSINVNSIVKDNYTYYKGSAWAGHAGSCCGGVNWVYSNVLYRTSSSNTSFTTTYNTTRSTTTTFNTSQSTTTTFNTTRSTTTTFNTSRSTTTTFSTSRTTDRTTDFYA